MRPVTVADVAEPLTVTGVAEGLGCTTNELGVPPVVRIPTQSGHLLRWTAGHLRTLARRAGTRSWPVPELHLPLGDTVSPTAGR